MNPAQALCRIFGDARIDVYADGLMSYGPTRTTLPGMVAGRIERLLHLDLVPGVTPLLLSASTRVTGIRLLFWKGVSRSNISSVPRRATGNP